MAERLVQFVGETAPGVDYELASVHVKAFPNRTVVEMAPVPEMAGGLLIANGEGSEWRIRPDVGVVISAGKGVGLLPGDVVCVDHEHGKRLKNFHAGSYVAGDEVRMYGCACKSGRKAVKVPWNRSILGLVDFSEEGIAVRATHGNVIIDRGDILDQTASGLLLPDTVTHRESKGVVMSVGSGVQPEIQPGMTVFYMANLMLPMKGLFGFDDGKKIPRNWGIVPGDGVLCEVSV